MCEQKKILGIPYTEFGSTIKIGGMVLDGNGKTYTVLFPETNRSNLAHGLNYQLNYEEWKELIRQLDLVETEVLDPNNKFQKIIVRKSVYEIEQGIKWRVFKRDNYTCRYCGNDNTPLTVDHILLWEKMGPSVEDNLITACRNCNKTRGNMEYPDWLKSSYYLKVIKSYNGPEHELNKKAWEAAKNLPLRTIKRGR